MVAQHSLLTLWRMSLLKMNKMVGVLWLKRIIVVLFQNVFPHLSPSIWGGENGGVVVLFPTSLRASGLVIIVVLFQRVLSHLS